MNLWWKDEGKSLVLSMQKTSEEDHSEVDIRAGILQPLLRIEDTSCPLEEDNSRHPPAFNLEESDSHSTEAY